MTKSKLSAVVLLGCLLLSTACGPKATQEQASPTEPPTSISLPTVEPITNAIQITAIDPPVANGLSINDPITIDLAYGLAEAQGQVQIWFESFLDDQCTQLGVNPGDPKGGSTLPGGIMQYVGAGNQEISISIPPVPPIGALFIGVGARLWNVDGTASLAEDMDYLYCYAARAAEPGVPPPGQGAGTTTALIATHTPPSPGSPPAAPTGTVTGTVYADDNSNGVQDIGEAGIPSIPITYTDASGITVLGTIATDANGNFTFTGLDLNVVHIFVLNYTAPGPVVPGYSWGVLFSGPVTQTISFGIQPPALPPPPPPPPTGTGVINVLVFSDANGDNSWNVGETGLSGISVNLYDSGGTLLASSSSVDGIVTFRNLPAGTYTVEAVGVTCSVHPCRGTYSIGDGEIIPVNMGIVPSAPPPPPPPTGTGGIDVWLYLDANSDDSWNEGETWLSGITVNLYDSGGRLLSSYVSPSDGKIMIDNMPAGDYTVEAVGVTCTIHPCRRTFSLGDGMLTNVTLGIAP